MGSTFESVLMWCLSVAFAARVSGQIAAGLWQPRWLPPFHRWYSGRLAYRYLLPAQLVILGGMVALNRALGHGFSVEERWGVAGAAVVTGLALLYAAAMVVRWARRSLQPPERRGVLIPIPFHLVLALYLFLGGRT